MNKRMISKLLLSSMLVMTSVPIYEQSFAAENVKSSATSTFAVVKKQVNFRNAPSTKSLIIGKLAQDEKVQIVEKVNPYCVAAHVKWRRESYRQ